MFTSAENWCCCCCFTLKESQHWEEFGSILSNSTQVSPIECVDDDADNNDDEQ